MASFSFARFVILAGVVVFAFGGAARAHAANVGVDATLVCVMKGEERLLEITLRNVGRTDSAIVLGIILGNGNRYIAENLALEIRTATSTTPYRYADPKPSVIAGRVDPWIVGLPMHSEFKLTRSLEHFWAGATRLDQLQFPYEVRVVFIAPPVPAGYPIPIYKAYQGELNSGWLEMPKDCASPST